MDEFKSHIGLSLRNNSLERDRLQELAVSQVAFVEEGAGPGEMPCWLCVVSVPALDAIDDPDGELYIIP